MHGDLVWGSGLTRIHLHLVVVLVCATQIGLGGKLEVVRQRWPGNNPCWEQCGPCSGNGMYVGHGEGCSVSGRNNRSIYQSNEISKMEDTGMESAN